MSWLGNIFEDIFNGIKSATTAPFTTIGKIGSGQNIFQSGVQGISQGVAGIHQSIVAPGTSVLELLPVKAQNLPIVSTVLSTDRASKNITHGDFSSGALTNFWRGEAQTGAAVLGGFVAAPYIAGTSLVLPTTSEASMGLLGASAAKQLLSGNVSGALQAGLGAAGVDIPAPIDSILDGLQPAPAVGPRKPPNLVGASPSQVAGAVTPQVGSGTVILLGLGAVALYVWVKK